ncbi:MAG TPA: hypothetical protein VNQ73_18935 [Ilumatobacter sp.]|nr:hypothetical protein [Ilumatobacter sp.]
MAITSDITSADPAALHRYDTNATKQREQVATYLAPVRSAWRRCEYASPDFGVADDVTASVDVMLHREMRQLEALTRQVRLALLDADRGSGRILSAPSRAVDAKLAELRVRAPKWPTGRPLSDAEMNGAAKQVFSDAHMRGFVGTHVQGANDPRLNAIMEAIQYRDPTAAEVAEIAEIRGVPLDQIRAGYERYRRLRAQVGKIEPINAGRHPGFLGSTWSLRYGAVAGDVLGIDPVFGAQLNPSGGLVGPANDSVRVAGESRLGYHGTFHDAAGFLYTKLGVGPGYSYVPGDDGDDGDPLAGQVKGTWYWRVDPTEAVSAIARIKALETETKARGKAADAAAAAQQKWQDAKGWTADTAGGAARWASDRWRDAKGTGSKVDDALDRLNDLRNPAPGWALGW